MEFIHESSKVGRFDACLRDGDAVILARDVALEGRGLAALTVDEVDGFLGAIEVAPGDHHADRIVAHGGQQQARQIAKRGFGFNLQNQARALAGQSVQRSLRLKEAISGPRRR